MTLGNKQHKWRWLTANTVSRRNQEYLRLLTLNLVRWLSRMGSLYRQLQQLPIASAGQLKPVAGSKHHHALPLTRNTEVYNFF